jgi:hypothetical protein
VLGAIALVLAAVVFFSAGGWFEKRERFSVYFPGSVRGLNPGAPVTFRGIKIGEVARWAVPPASPPPGPDRDRLRVDGDIEASRRAARSPGFRPRDGGVQTRGFRGRLEPEPAHGPKYID